jgi:hypothetical protein
MAHNLSVRLATQGHLKRHRRRARVAFLEPALRFVDVTLIGLLGGFVLLVQGAPNGLLFDAVVGLWHAAPAEEASVSGALAQVTLTVWALVASIGGATYIEASRTIRHRSRHIVDVLNSADLHLSKGRSYSRTPYDLRGELVSIARDTPLLGTLASGPREAFAALQAQYPEVNDYWNMRAGYRSRPSLLKLSKKSRKAYAKQDRTVIFWRTLAIVAIATGIAMLAFCGIQNLAGPPTLFVGIISGIHAREILLGRGWPE